MNDWNEIRDTVRKRDREQCMNCHRSAGSTTLDVHHIVPRGQGGSDQLSNLVLLCRQCHDAAHGKRMAPVIRSYSNGEMASDTFELYLEFWKQSEFARYSDEEECWYVPKADMDEFLQSMKEGVEEGTTMGLGQFM